MELFEKDKRKKDGRSVRCKACATAQITAYYRANPETLREYRHSQQGRQIWNRQKNRRRAIKAGLPSEPYNAFDIYDRDRGTCSLCGEPCEKYKPNGHRAFHIEHVVPLQVDTALLLSFGITEHPGDVKSNVTIAHPSCNSSKQHRMTQGDANNYFRLRDLYKEQHDTTDAS